MTAIILAAGKGTRLKSISNQNKVVRNLVGKPMITYAVANLKKAGVEDIIVVVGFAAESVKQALGNQVTYATQHEALGTADALKTGLKIGVKSRSVISLYGDDSAFYPPKLYQHLQQVHRDTAAAITVLTITKDDPTGLGRIIRNSKGDVVKIVEEKNATAGERAVKEINTGLYCFDTSFIVEAVDKVTQNPVSGEFYLTDVVGIAVREGEKVAAVKYEDDSVWFGVNTPSELQAARHKMSNSLSRKS
jgi:bifunctional UDP-N-acetylglucosamine pyrophosphorylase / glucosamine-1-phosphate N-acetyltransferase